MYKLIRSPKRGKKFRIVAPNGKSVDFGAKGYSDYTLHKDAFRMRSYVARHGGVMPKSLKMEKNVLRTHSKMSKVRTSLKENWKKSGMKSAGFWSRWLLWSEPTIEEAKSLIESKFKIRII